MGYHTTSDAVARRLPLSVSAVTLTTPPRVCMAPAVGVHPGSRRSMEVSLDAHTGGARAGELLLLAQSYRWTTYRRVEASEGAPSAAVLTRLLEAAYAKAPTLEKGTACT